MGWRGALRGVAVDLATSALYLLLAMAATRFAVLETLSVWYAPAGLALAAGILRGWRALPSLALGEVLVGLLLFGVADDFGWLVVPNGVAYAAVYVAWGRWSRRLGMTDVAGTPLRRAHQGPWHPVLLVAGPLLVAPLAAATVGMTFQLLAGIAAPAELGSGVLVWWLGDAIGVGTIAITAMTVAVRGRRNGRWWALPDTATLPSTLAILSPAALVWLLTTVSDGGVVVFASAVFVPFLAIAVTKGIAGVGLAAPWTSLAMTLAADQAFPSDVLALSDLQLLLLTLLGTGIGVALVTEDRADLRVRLQQRTQHLDEAQAAARSGSFTWDVQDDRVTWSPGLYALLGVPDGPVTPQDHLDRVHPQDRDRVSAEIGRALVDGARVEHGYRVVRDDGTQLTVRATLDVLVEDGRITEVTGTCTDVSDEERTRQQLAAAVAREHAAREREAEAKVAVSRAERVKDALLVAVSHEVRTPLTVIGGIVETLRRPEYADRSTEEWDVMLQRLGRQTHRLRTVLQDLLDVDRIGRGVVEPVRRPCELPALLDEVSAMLDHTGRPLERALPPDALPLDGRLVARIIEHLLHNAVRHGEPGTPIRVTGTVRGETLELCVEDNGPGLAASDRERVFHAFEQGPVSAAKPGTGVGLFLVARFAELHGGRAWATDREDGPGAAFHVLLPLTGDVGTLREETAAAPHRA